MRPLVLILVMLLLGSRLFALSLPAHAAEQQIDCRTQWDMALTAEGLARGGVGAEQSVVVLSHIYKPTKGDEEIVAPILAAAMKKIVDGAQSFDKKSEDGLYSVLVYNLCMGTAHGV